MESMKRTISALSEKPSAAWTIARLAQLADLRRGPLPESIKAYASAISGFSKAAIEKACTTLESRERIDFEPAVPELARMLELCRKAELGKLKYATRTYCAECCEHEGMIYFDAARNGRRIPGDQVWKQPPGRRFAMPCPACREARIA